MPYKECTPTDPLVHTKRNAVDALDGLLAFKNRFFEK